MWLKAMSRSYSVKSDYRLLCDSEHSNLASASNSEASKKFWAGVWRLNVPSKVKSFVWRACTNSLPTLANLLKRKMVSSPTCSSCLREPETILHAVWGCDSIKSVWNRDFSGLNGGTHPLESFAELFGLVLVNPRGAELFAMTCWSLWTRWNKSRLGDRIEPLNKVSCLVCQQLSCF